LRKALIALLAPLALFAAPARAAPSDVAHMVPTVAEGKIVTWANPDAGKAGKKTVWGWVRAGLNANGRRRFPSPGSGGFITGRRTRNRGFMTWGNTWWKTASRVWLRPERIYVKPAE